MMHFHIASLHASLLGPFAARLRRIAVAAAGLAILALPCTALQAALLQVQLPAQVELKRTQVLLGDVASITSTDVDLLRRVMALPLGQAPGIGRVMALPAQRIETWIKNRTGLRSDEIDWSGAQEITLSVPGQEVPGERIADVAASALRQHLHAQALEQQLQKPRIEIQAIAIPANLLLPREDLELSVRPLAATPLRNRMLVWVDVATNGQHVRTVPVHFSVSVFAQSAVATQGMVQGKTLQASDVVMKEIDLAKSSAAQTVSASQAVAQQLRKPLRTGEPISAENLRAMPAVARGEWARLVSASGSMTLESQVQVLQDGYVGQVVRVQARNASGSLNARVTGPGHLELQQ